MRSFLERCFDALQSSGAGKRNAGGMWPVSALPYQPEADVDRSPAAGGVLNRLGGDQLRYTDVRQRILSIDGAGRWKLVEGGYTVIQPVVEGEGAAVFRRWRVRVKNLSTSSACSHLRSGTRFVGNLFAGGMAARIHSGLAALPGACGVCGRVHREENDSSGRSEAEGQGAGVHSDVAEPLLGGRD